MKVKRYIVNALPEALPMIRSELGIDAVILNTKEIRVGGFLGMFGKKKTEVIAAVESNGAEGAKASARPSAAPSKPALSPEAVATMAATLSAAVANREKPSAMTAAAARSSATAVLEPERELFGQGAVAVAAAPIAPAAPAASAASAPAPAAVYAARTGTAASAVPDRAFAGNGLSRPAASAAAPAAAPSSEPRKQRASDDALMDEIRDMKQWIMRISDQQRLISRPEAVQALLERLAEQEVGEQWADRLIEAVESRLAAELAEHEVPARSAVWHHAERELLDWLSGFEDGAIAPDTRVVHFVGPTGVGKTTSIAKLAAEQTLKAGRKVGFITADTYRIAAVDQLRTYATILNVPLEVVFSPSEVARAFNALADRELIFMDTAGRNFRNELYVSEVNSLLQSGNRSETLLVLSLTGKFSDMSAVAGNFAKFGVTRVLYTKQDETGAIGSILNLAMEHGLKPTFIAYGQTVPDDIAAFNARTYVAQLLGASHE